MTACVIPDVTADTVKRAAERQVHGSGDGADACRPYRREKKTD